MGLVQGKSQMVMLDADGKMFPAMRERWEASVEAEMKDAVERRGAGRVRGRFDAGKRAAGGGRAADAVFRDMQIEEAKAVDVFERLRRMQLLTRYVAPRGYNEDHLHKSNLRSRVALGLTRGGIAGDRGWGPGGEFGGRRTAHLVVREGWRLPDRLLPAHRH